MVTENPTKFVLLLRVSTKRQGADGNGIAAQRRDIDLFLKHQKNPVVIKEFVEVESGASSDRPIFDEALELCRRTKSALLAQKVDRITRDLEVLARLVKDKTVPIRIACLPNADSFQIHLFGCLASEEKKFISRRTKVAMAEAKKRGVKFGNPNLAKLNRTRNYQAKRFADENADLIKVLRKEGKTLRAISDVLNQSGLKTRNGCAFHPVQVHRILKRSKVEVFQ